MNAFSSREARNLGSLVEQAQGGEREPNAAGWQSRWQSAFGEIVIEVRGDDVFVNGDRVVPAGRRDDSSRI